LRTDLAMIVENISQPHNPHETEVAPRSNVG
jgi:hypothetical protein